MRTLILNPMQEVMDSSETYDKGNTALAMCPICGHGKLLVREKGWGCNQCGYIIYRRQLTVMLDEKDVSRLVNGRLTESKVFKNLRGKRYHARLKLDTDGKVLLISSSVRYTNCICPECKGRIRETKYCYICENSILKQCNFRVWKIWHGHLFTPEDVEALITNGQTDIYRDFRDVSGNTYEARLILNEALKPILYRVNGSHKQSV